MSHADRCRQRGAALLVSMVMIFVLSIMGVSVMRGATLERRMASNAIQSSTTLQTAESATELMLNTEAVLARAAGAFQQILEIDTEEVVPDVVTRGTSEIVYMSDGLPVGFSSGTFRTLRLVAQGDVSMDSVRSRSIVRQGADRLAPALQR